MSVHRSRELQFSRRELVDLGIAWAALAVAFAIFFGRPARLVARPAWAAQLVVLSALTVGVGFMLHELAHKAMAVRFGQLAEFRADYGMLFVAIMSALIGFIFAAPGAVHHRGRVTQRQHGLIAVAGPITNLLLVAAFAPLLLLDGFLYRVGAFGVLVNAFLAAFNMIPYGPLDGRTVLSWNEVVFAATLVASVLLTVLAFLTVGIPSW